VSGDERVTLSSDSLDVRGAKEFDWVLTPLRAGHLELPGVRYPFFDPMLRRYQVAVTPVLPLDVEPGALVADTGTAGRPRLAVRTAYRGALPPEPFTRRPFWWAVIVAPVPAAAAFFARRPRRRRAPAPPVRTLHELARGAHAASACAVRRSFLEALAARLDARVSMLAEPRALVRVARRAGVTPAAADTAAAVLEELNAAAFGADHPTAPDLATRAEQAYHAVDTEARAPRAHHASRALLLLLGVTLALGSAARAAAPDPAAAQFARGVDAYNRGHFGIAEREFAAVADRAPRAADAWANFGTAAFAARDTAHAALGWQRALRLEPRAADVRDRLELLGLASGMGAVPSISARTFAVAALVLWIGGWLALAWRPRRRSRARRRPVVDSRLAAGALAVAMALGAVAAGVHARLAARDLAVVAHDGTLRILPALGGDARASVRAGEIARITRREGQWARVVADGGREGWLELTTLYPIARD
jgi:tetratricopeptide (TPR) repeat protein